MSTCLVLGANGLIGSFLVEQLAAKGHSVKAFDRFSRKQKFKEMPGIEVVKGDYVRLGAVESALDGIDIVFHCIHTTVPRTSLGNAAMDAETNILPSVRLLEACLKKGVKKLVYLSSIAVYGEPKKSPISESLEPIPVSPYGVSKIAIEEYVKYYGRVHGLDYVIVRPSATYGERQKISKESGVVTSFVNSALKGEKISIYGDGNAVRDLTHAEDIAKGCIEAGFKKTKSRLFNLGTGKGVKLNELAEIVKKAVGKNIEVEHVAGKQGVQEHVYDVSRAFKELGWQAKISIEEGVKRCVEGFSGGI